MYSTSNIPSCNNLLITKLTWDNVAGIVTLANAAIMPFIQNNQFNHHDQMSIYSPVGKTDSKLPTIKFHNFPTMYAHFLTNGTDVLLTSNKRYFALMAWTPAKSREWRLSMASMIENFKVLPNGKHFVFLSK